MVPETGERMITAVDCTIVRFDQSKLLPEFCAYYSQASDYLAAVEREATGTALSSGLRVSELARVLPLCLHQDKVRIMQVAIRKMGNSQGVLIPKPILAQLGLEGTADLQVRDGVIEIRAIQRNPREGWAADASRLAAQGGDAPVWPEVANEGDAELVW